MNSPLRSTNLDHPTAADPHRSPHAVPQTEETIRP
jgi:hypothetical protein